MGAQFGAAALPLGLPSLGPFLRGEYGLSLAWLGALLAVPTAGLAAMSLAWGSLSDRIGERPVLVAGMVGAAGFLVAASTFPGDSPQFAGLLFLAGASGASAPAASGRAVVGWFNATERGMALSWRHTAPMAGGAAAAAVLPSMAQAGGLRAACLVLAAAELVGAVCALTITEPPGTARLTREEAGPHPARDRLVWTLAAGGALVVIAQGVLTRFLPDYLHAERGWSAAAAGAALSAALVCAGIMRILAGMSSDRHGRRIVTLRTQAAAAGVLLLGATLASPLASMVVAVALVTATGLTMAGNGVAWAAVSEAVPARAGAALGLYSTLLVGVITVAPTLFGAAVHGHSLARGFAVIALFPLVGALVFVVAERLRLARGAVAA